MKVLYPKLYMAHLLALNVLLLPNNYFYLSPSKSRDKFSIKIYIIVTDAVHDVTYSHKSVNTRVVITLLIT